MSNQSTSWRHHYITQFYLQQWALDGGRLWETKKIAHNQKIVSYPKFPKETGFASYLNTLEPDLVTISDPNALEKRLAVEDDRACHALNALLEADRSGVPIEIKRAWAWFMYLQRERHPEKMARRIELGEQIREEILTSTPWLPPDSTVRDLFSPEMVRNLARSWMVSSAREQDWESLAEWTWYIVGGRRDFITTDSPVLLNAAHGEAEEASVYMVSMALSPKRLLICVPASWAAEIDDEWLGVVTTMHNGLLISLGPSYIYSSVALGGMSEINLLAMAAHCLKPYCEPG
ncbi:DUF4238 domain-containing protein [Paraliomyxa miuraensis]|uniref:DUF4238 domain-containing protein n=1 Tax=Paraliomyxa miuraensis TaxID=376150 RepID=UPI002257FE46|nr:DUF4238 domain-containing protein [Paraliomyxa miuraensis]MCX4244226.1 DUF4238 domain-containing protein [Paraliomyxa miuraensis]